MNGGPVLPSSFLISIFLFSKFRKLQAGACRAAAMVGRRVMIELV